MNFKFGLIAFILGFALITSCTKENIDDTTVDEDEVITQVDSCSINLEITNYGGGILTVDANGGTAPYIYQWSNESTADSIAVDPGTYGVTATDSEGCIATDSITVGGSDPCNSFDAYISVDGGMFVRANGGTPPYNYIWSTGDTTDLIVPTTNGTYEVTVTDSQGCTITLSADFDGTDACNSLGVELDTLGNNTLTAYGFGGTPPYLYEWSTGEVSQSITVSSDGTYEVTVTDSQGCTYSTSITVGGSDPCNSFDAYTYVDGGVGVHVSGGTPPYIYTWSTGETTDFIMPNNTGTYEVTVTDSQGCTITNSVTYDGMGSCDSLYVEIGVSGMTLTAYVYGGTAPYSYQWSTGEMSQNITVSNDGTYQVTVTDSQGCTYSNSITVGADPCNSFEAYTYVDGGVGVHVSGGTQPYTYIWSTGETTDFIVPNSNGIYEITVTDSQGCTITSSVTYDGAGLCNSLAAFIYADSLENVLIAEAIGGTAPYVYQWSTGEISQSITVSGAGTYQVTVTDSQGCIYSTSTTIDGCSSLSVSFELDAAGTTLTATGNGGTPPYAYLWYYPDGDTTNTASISVMSGLTYGIYMYDSQGCALEEIYTVP